ncbi:hypothetical protein HZA87_05365 [Candidatus Uhrbacteria bacterium]|nr:hypothetical protein [Candidatus Uhrbacteria bacterium]
MADLNSDTESGAENIKKKKSKKQAPAPTSAEATALAGAEQPKNAAHFDKETLGQLMETPDAAIANEAYASTKTDRRTFERHETAKFDLYAKAKRIDELLLLGNQIKTKKMDEALGEMKMITEKIMTELAAIGDHVRYSLSRDDAQKFYDKELVTQFPANLDGSRTNMMRNECRLWLEEVGTLPAEFHMEKHLKVLMSGTELFKHVGNFLWPLLMTMGEWRLELPKDENPDISERYSNNTDLVRSDKKIQDKSRTMQSDTEARNQMIALSKEMTPVLEELTSILQPNSHSVNKRINRLLGKMEGPMTKAKQFRAMVPASHEKWLTGNLSGENQDHDALLVDILQWQKDYAAVQALPQTNPDESFAAFKESRNVEVRGIALLENLQKYLGTLSWSMT